MEKDRCNDIIILITCRKTNKFTLAYFNFTEQLNRNQPRAI